MDPNGDGFISKLPTGFSEDGYNVDEFEITMFGIPKLGGDVTGDNIGNSCGITDLIPDKFGYSSYAVRDGANNIIFRFRVGDDNPSVESWTILLDTDGLFGADDPNATPSNPGFEIDITLIKRNNAGVYVYNINGIENCPGPSLSYPIDSHFQISIADTITCGDPDYFYDYYVPFAEIATAFGINVNTGLRYVAVTNVSATCAMSGTIADVSGIDNDDPAYAGCVPCAFEALVGNQCPTAIIDLCETCPGFAVDPVAAPHIDEPIRAGQRRISGSSESGIYIVVKAYPRIGGTDASPIWDTTPRETKAAYAVGIFWEVLLTNPLIAYDKIVAQALKDEFSVPCGLDNNESSSTSTTVVEPNTKPFADNQSVNVVEDTQTAIVLTGSDPEGYAIKYYIVTQPSHGTVSISGTTPNVTYTPALNYNGPDNFTFKTSDDIFDSNPVGTVTITVTPVNDAPIANNQNVAAVEDLGKAFTLTGSDVDGNPLTYIIVSGPAHGVLTGAIPNLTYTSNLNYNGSDTFTFKVNDGTTDSNVAIVTIAVSPVQDPPTANNQSVSVVEDVATALTLTGADVDGDALTYSVVTPPAHGTLSGTGPNLTYTPALNYNGSDSFTFRVNDGNTNSADATISITVTPVNDAPIANNQSVSIVEDVPTPITLTGSDVDGNPLTYNIVSGPTHGVLTGSIPNLTYTSNLNYNGSDSFTFRVNDGSVNSNVATVAITVTPAPDAPIADDQSVTVVEDVIKSIILNATDPDGSALTYTVLSPPTHGTLNGTAPNLTYTPDLNYNGSDSFTFKANDGTSDSNTGTVSITVDPANDAPVANSQTVIYVQDTDKPMVLSGSDIDGNPLTYIIITSPTSGTLINIAGANVTYRPNPGFTGSDSFTFKVNDGTTDSNIATVTLNLAPVINTRAVANPFHVDVPEDVPTSTILSATDLDGDPLVYSLVDPPAHGTLSGSGFNLTYTPDLNYNGPDQFTFRAHDGIGFSNIATVTITVTPVNDAPTANDQSVTTPEEVGKVITFTGSDVEGTALLYDIVSGPTNGTLTGTGSSRTYTPNLNFNGSDSFTFKANDGTDDSNVATVSITVTPVNDAPIANDLNVSIVEDVSTPITVTASDVDGNPMSYTQLSSPAHGTLSGTAPNFTYTPNLNYTGADSFTFKVNDGTVDSNIATVSIDVTPVNDAPIADSQSATMPEDIAQAITLTGSDLEGNPLTFTITTQPIHGTLTGSGNNVTYTPALNYNGNDSFMFKVNDGSADSNIATVSIIVNPVNDAPVANNQSVITSEDVATGVIPTGSDVDGDVITYIVVTPPAHGSLSGTGPNYTYTPNPNFTGSDSFTFKTNDGTVDSNIATVTITITSVNDIPVANNQGVTTPEDVAKPITLVGTDVDAGTLTYTIVVPPSKGTLTGTQPNLTYTPDLNYYGPDSFTFKVNDGIVDSNIATVTITVTPVNDPPIIVAVDYTPPNHYVFEDSVFDDSITPEGVCLSVSDVDGDNIVYSPSPTNTKGGGTMVLRTDSFNFCYLFTPPPNYNGESIWNFTITDGIATAGTQVKLLVLPVNDPPVAFNDYVEVAGREPIIYNVLENDLPIVAPFKEFYDIFERDSVDVLTLKSIVTPPLNGTAILHPDGTIEYTANFDYVDQLSTGSADSVVYRVCDSGRLSLCDTATLFITIGPPSFKIYEAVSSNGDGINDYWRIDGVEAEPYNKNYVRVFDRYNNLVFETKDYNNKENSWQGESNHGLVKGALPEGTYFYTFILDSGQVFSGFVFLKRQ